MSNENKTEWVDFLEQAEYLIRQGYIFNKEPVELAKALFESYLKSDNNVPKFLQEGGNEASNNK